MRAHLRNALATAAILLAACGGGQDSGSPAHSAAANPAASGGARTAALPPSLRALAVPGALNNVLAARQKLDQRLQRATGSVKVWITLQDSAVAAYKSERLAAMGLSMQPRAQAVGAGARGLREAASSPALKSELQSYKATVLANQAVLASQLQTVGARELARVHVAHNAIAVQVDAAMLPRIAAMNGVSKIRPVVNYTLEPLTAAPKGKTVETYSGNTADGTGVRIAIIDSGIDYTHYNLGGPGTVAAYAAAYGDSTDDPRNTRRDGLFPTAKVVDGYDFVGESWPNGDEAPDDDPIDYEGHGTHVADIAAGRSADGKHRGIAPGAKLIAVKVCSSVASACSGIALLQGMDFAIDPNGDGDYDDAADVINLSLGSLYGQQEDDLTVAVSNAVKLGVVVVAAAGNDGNLPYVVSSPSIAPAAISVAQTAMPYDKAYPVVITAPAAIAGSYTNTSGVEWAPINAAVSGSVAFVGRGCPADDVAGTPADPYLSSPAGKIALIDRGSCAVSLKVDRAAKAGAVGVLIGLVAAGDPFAFSLGGGTQFVPTLVITQALSQAIKAPLAATPPVAVTASFSPNISVSLASSIISSSARGPSSSYQTIKPEIGAPGATISAVVGSGDQNESFGGTSGATPVVAGSAALLVGAFPTRSPEQIKAQLMNSAETAVYTNPATQPGVLAPITRIGSGEVRVNRALGLNAVARDVINHSAALSYGAVNVSGTQDIERRLLVENFGAAPKTFAIQSSFRYADDQASGAVVVDTPASVSVPAHGSQTVSIKLHIDGRKLPEWTLNGGELGGSGSALDKPEYDGYVTLTAGSERLSVPWHVLPRKSASFVVDNNALTLKQKFTLYNPGVEQGDFEVFSLTGVSPNKFYQPNPGSNIALTDLRAVGARLAAPGYLQFAISTFGRRAHPAYPSGLEVDIDADGDGIVDAYVYNTEMTAFGYPGSTGVAVVSAITGVSGVFFFDDADLNSSNSIFTVPTEALGIPDDATFKFKVYAFDNYFSGATTDETYWMTYTPTRPRYVANGVPPGPSLAPGAHWKMGVTAPWGGAAGSPSQIGLLLMYYRAAGREAEIIRVTGDNN